MRQQARKDILPTGYFDEEKLLVFLADLNNRRDKNYLAFRFCLKNEYEKKLPDGFDAFAELAQKIADLPFRKD